MNAAEILARAASRDLLPTQLSTAEMRDEIAKEIRTRSLFVARGTNLQFITKLADVLDRYLGGQINDATARAELLQELQILGYNPEEGFPSDDLLVSPVEPGSFQDISSPKRLQFILDTQAQLMFGAGQKASGETPNNTFDFPAWELVRVADREVPRGQRKTKGGLVADPANGWPARWDRAGHSLIQGRMIALKGDPIWAKLGDGSLFSDALDTDHPPFAFNSGMGWQRVSRQDCITLGLINQDWKPKKFPVATPGTEVPIGPITKIPKDILLELKHQGEIEIAQEEGDQVARWAAIREDYNKRS